MVLGRAFLTNIFYLDYNSLYLKEILNLVI